VHRGTIVAHATIGIMTATFLLVLVVVLVVGGLIYGVVSLLSGDDPGLVPAEPDGRARPLPNDRSLREDDLKEIRFDVALRGYRMSQVDRMLRRVAYDLGYKDEMIAVLEAEVAALREGRLEDAELLRKAREAAATPERDTREPDPTGEPAGSSEPMVDLGEVGSAAPAAVGGSPDGRPSGDEPDRTVTAGDERTAAGEPEPPREGSLRRREPVTSAAPVVTGAPVVTDAPAVAPAPDAADGTGADEPAVDGADRPAHA
jgi:DivIVA domain-containing protein